MIHYLEEPPFRNLARISSSVKRRVSRFSIATRSSIGKYAISREKRVVLTFVSMTVMLDRTGLVRVRLLVVYKCMLAPVVDDETQA